MTTPTTSEQNTSALAGEDPPSALRDMNDPAFPAALVDTSEIISGGPPPDGIPPLDRPTFSSVADTDYLNDQEPVLALTVGDETKAYPVQVMIWHEIVNDTIGGEPVSVSYCPLCNSAVAYLRTFEASDGTDVVLDFGTSGRLFQSALVMYDRQTESLWSHFTGEAIVGALTGAELDLVPLATVSWEDFREANPDALVLSRDTGFNRSYGSNPYEGYDDIGASPFLFRGETDPRLAAKTRIVGVRDADSDTSVGLQLDELAAEGVLEFRLAGQDLVAWVEPGLNSALDSGSISNGRDVGATGVFEATFTPSGGESVVLRFERTEDGFIDDVTASTWNVLGTAVEGELVGSQLTRVEHVDTFWFAWAAFQPETTVIPATQ